MTVLKEGKAGAATLSISSASKTLRIAWISDFGGGGGVPGMATQLVAALCEQDCELAVFTRTSRQEIERFFSDHILRKTSFFVSTHKWEWGKWYSRDPRIAFIPSFLKRISAEKALVSSLFAEHLRDPFDAIVRFSQIELFALRRHASRLPIIIYPCVHADGERQACIREESIARECEPWWWRVFRGFYLELRSRMQARDLRLVRKIIGMSQIFNQKLKEDYGLERAKFGVVYHPIPIDRISALKRCPDRKIHLLFVGRISVRKGIELILEAAPSIVAKHLDVDITIIGGGSLWSNYEPLLGKGLSEGLLWKGSLKHNDVINAMEHSDILLIPSHYEPGGIVVGEALAAGMLVVASNVVGSAEVLSDQVCLRFPVGDLSGFLIAVDAAIHRVRASAGEPRRAARSECEKHFSLPVVSEALMDQLRGL